MDKKGFARFETKHSWLSSEFGENYARKLFGDVIVDSLPRYVRGKRKGLLKGYIEWRKCVAGGWVKTGRRSEDDYYAGAPAIGYVESRIGKTIAAGIIDGKGDCVAFFNFPKRTWDSKKICIDKWLSDTLGDAFPKCNLDYDSVSLAH